MALKKFCREYQGIFLVFRLLMCLARQGLLQVFVSWYLLMTKGVEQMMQVLSSLSLPDFLRSRLMQLFEQNFVGSVCIEENSLPHSAQIHKRTGRCSNCLRPLSDIDLRPSSDLCHSCSFSEFLAIRLERVSDSSNRWSLLCSA